MLLPLIDRLPTILVRLDIKSNTYQKLTLAKSGFVHLLWENSCSFLLHFEFLVRILGLKGSLSLSALHQLSFQFQKKATKALTIIGLSSGSTTNTAFL